MNEYPEPRKVPEIQEIEERIFSMLGEASALFMSQPVKGTEMVMPSDELRKLGQNFLDQIALRQNDLKAEEIALADGRLSSEFGEDWLAYRDARLKELADERDKIRTARPNGQE
jgi:hypothetical protein